MQILAGKYRRHRLASSTSPKVRPTARRLREALFAALDAEIVGARFLDLCAGSGSIGLEALSRGAAHVTFIERSPKFADLIEQNLATCGVTGAEARVIVTEAAPFLAQAARQKLSWDMVFYDPPYDSDYGPVLAWLAEGAIIAPSGVVVVEHLVAKSLPVNLGQLLLATRVSEGKAGLSFYL